MSRVLEDATAFDGYRLVATVNGDVEMVCLYCPDLPWRYEPSVTNLLEIVQTVRTHNERCLTRQIQAVKATLRRAGNKNPTTTEVEPFIPEPLKRAFWQRYIGEYFDKALEVAGE